MQGVGDTKGVGVSLKKQDALGCVHVLQADWKTEVTADIVTLKHGQSTGVKVDSDN